jgi:hypothetical protein
VSHGLRLGQVVSKFEAKFQSVPRPRSAPNPACNPSAVLRPASEF